MQVENTPISGLMCITPKRFGDHRGFFSESWNGKTIRDNGLELPEFVQDNHSISKAVGTVRGLHFQKPPHEQGKLVRCGRGAIFDVAVDIRADSPTYGKWYGEELSFENGRQFWVPAGFMHGFITLLPDSEAIYKCTDYYSPESNGVVKWDSCGIDWPSLGVAPIISPQDEMAHPFAEFITPFSGSEWL